MEELLAHERAAEQHVHTLLKSTDVPLADIAAACNGYRSVCQTAIFADFQNSEHHETRLWQAHTDVRKYFHKSLKNFVRSYPDRPVETRQIMKHFLEFLKHSQRFYREYISVLSAACGGISELGAIAHTDPTVQSSLLILPAGLHKQAFESCHRSLIYLGDLSRYRTTEKLDKNPNFAHAIGYYDLAATLQPNSGLGHHQQAVVALEERNHLRAIYHLYRAITIEEPHPLAARNLELEFGKTTAAWDKGELIPKGPSSHLDAPKHALVGWFVRLHSMCYKGEHFRGYEELEQEVLSQLANIFKHQPPERLLMRMTIVNLAAQYASGENFQNNPTEQFQQSFFYFFRFNLRTFTTLLRVFYDDLHALLLNMDSHDVELSQKLTQTACRLLPCLRIYNNWLLSQVHMIQGLANEPFIQDSVQSFWPVYAKTIDLIAQAFPIWDLEDIPEVSYMLEEDVDTMGFKPVLDEKTRKTWFQKDSIAAKPRFSDANAVRVSPGEEMLQRVKDFLTDGLYLANNDDTAPIQLRGTRIFSGDENQVDALTVRPPQHPEHVAPRQSQPVPEKPKVVSYAAAAANGHARHIRPTPVQRTVSSKTQSRDDQLSRMVDDLVDDDDVNNPATPPQQLASNPAIVTNGEDPHALHDSVTDLPPAVGKHGPYSKRPLNGSAGPHRNIAITPPAIRPSTSATRPGSGQYGLTPVSKLWDEGRSSTISSSFPSGLPGGTLGSPDIGTARSHSRMNSASSVRSRNSLMAADSWRSNEPGLHSIPDTVGSKTMYRSRSSLDQTGMASPLLFGAGGGPWSPTLPIGSRNTSPPHGQG